MIRPDEPVEEWPPREWAPWYVSFFFCLGGLLILAGVAVGLWALIRYVSG